MTANSDRFTRRMLRMEKTLKSLATQPQLAHSAVEGGSIQFNDDEGNLKATIGLQHDGTSTVAIFNGPTPPTPSTPVVSGVSGGVKVRWDGTFVDAIAAPMDFSRVEIHVSTVSGFDALGADTLRGSFESPRGGEFYVSLPAGSGVTHYVVLVTRGQSGNRSANSIEASGVPVAPAVAAPTSPPTSSPSILVTPGADLFVLRSDNGDPEWANDEIEYHVSATEGFVPVAGDSATLLGTTKGVLVSRFLPDGVTPFEREVTYHFRALATNSLGVSPTASAQVSAMLDPAAIQEVVAAEIVAGFILAGRVQVGQGYIDANEGIVLPQPDGTITRFPVDGITPATISGYLIANGMTMKDGAYFYGLSQISGQFLLNDGVPNPTKAPTLSVGWEQTQLDHALGDGLAVTKSVGFWIGAIAAWSDTDRASVTITDRQGAAVKDVGIDVGFDCEGGIVRIGDTYYILGKDRSRNNHWYVYTYDADTLEATANFDYGTQTPSVTKTAEYLIHTDSSRVLKISTTDPASQAGGHTEIIISWVSTVNQVHLRRLNADMTLIENRNLFAVTSGTTLGAVVWDSIIANRVYFATGFNGPGSSAVWAVDDTTWTRTTLQDFQRAADRVVEGMVFYQERTDSPSAIPRLASINGSRIYHYSIHPDEYAQEVGYTWYDADSGGTGTHETKLSPVKTISIPARQVLFVDCAPPPHQGVVDPLQLDKANRVRIYRKISSAYVPYFYQPPVDVSYFGLWRTDQSGSGNPPATNQFTNTSVATGVLESTVEDAGGPLVKISGDGTWRLSPLTDAWKAYTPTWTGATNPALNDGTIVGAYAKIGRTIHFRITLTIGSTTTLGTGVYRFGLPVAASAGAGAVWMPVGGASIGRSGGSRFLRHAFIASTTVIGVADDSGAQMSGAVPLALASGDVVHISGTYEAATA